MINTPLQIMLLSGSCANPSHTAANVRYLAKLLEDRGAIVDVWDIQSNPIPTNDTRYHEDPLSSTDPIVCELAERAQRADGFVWATPVYHNSFSGVLKNCLDNLSIKQFQDKPVALISNGPERSGVQPCDQMRIIVRGLLGVAIPTQIVTLSGDFILKDELYQLVNEKMRERFVRMADELIKYARVLRTMRAES